MFAKQQMFAKQKSALMNTSAKETLHTLKEMHLTTRDPTQDIRSRRVVGADVLPLGKVERLLVDHQPGRGVRGSRG
jgi:hypothetical protein